MIFPRGLSGFFLPFSLKSLKKSFLKENPSPLSHYFQSPLGSPLFKIPLSRFLNAKILGYFSGIPCV
jgi:hypothetical protein